MKKIIFSLLITISLSSLSISQNPKEETEHYPIVEIPIPDSIVLEVGGIEVLPGKRIAVSSRRGDIYVVEGAYTDDPGDD